MMSRESGEKMISKKERLNLYLVFSLFAIGIMSMAPRNPEIKHNLGVSNGTFGTLLSNGGLGSLISLMFGGQIVHRFGTRPVLMASSTILYVDIAMIPHIHRPTIFLISMIVMGFALSAYHIASNGQALKRQEEAGVLIIPKLHGAWSAGALSAAVFAFFITSHSTLAWHIDLLMLTIWSVTQFSLWNLRSVLIPGSKDHHTENTFSIRTLINAFTFEPAVTFGLMCALMIEYSTNDWATIFTKEEIGMSASLSILSYIVFVAAMISGRFTIHHFLVRWPEASLMKWGPQIGGAGFIIFAILGKSFSTHQHHLGFLLVLMAFASAGFGASHLAPTWFGIAGRRSSLPGSLVVAQLGLVTAVVSFFLKIVISWVAQSTSILVALMIPAAMLILGSRVSHLGSPEVRTR